MHDEEPHAADSISEETGSHVEGGIGDGQDAENHPDHRGAFAANIHGIGLHCHQVGPAHDRCDQSADQPNHVRRDPQAQRTKKQNAESSTPFPSPAKWRAKRRGWGLSQWLCEMDGTASNMRDSLLGDSLLGNGRQL